MPNILYKSGSIKDSGGGHITIALHAYSSVVQGTWAYILNNAQFCRGYYNNSSDADGDQLDYKVYLSKGTYSLALLVRTGSQRPILEFLVDGVSVGTLDMYSAGQVYNVVLTLTDIVISKSALSTLSLKVNGQHASSTGYLLLLTTLSLYRTA